MFENQLQDFIDLHGVHFAYFEGDCDEKFIKWLGFTKQTDGRWGADLESFLFQSGTKSSPPN